MLKWDKEVFIFQDYNGASVLLLYTMNDRTGVSMYDKNFEKQYTRNLLKKKFHYAWVVCFGCALMFFCTCGLSCNVFGVYSPFIMKQFGYTKTQVSLIGSARALSQILAIAAAGKYYKKLKARQGMLIAGSLCAVGYIVYGFSKIFPMFILGSGFVGFGYGLGAMVPISMILERWFRKDRTLAVSLVSAASGLATLGIPSLITVNIEKYSMSFAFIMEGIVMLILVFISFFFIRNNPSDMSIEAFGEKEEKEAEMYKTVSADSGHNAERKYITGKYWLVLYFMVVLATTFNSAGFGCLSLLVTTEGFDPGTVAVSLSVAGFMLMMGKFFFGICSTKFTQYSTSIAFGIICAVSALMCCFISLGKGMLFVSVGIFGGALSMYSVGQVSWLDEWASPEVKSEKVRLFQIIFAIGALFTNLLSGVLADACGGSYVPFYIICSAGAAGVTVIVWNTYRKLRRMNEQSVCNQR